MKNNNRNEATAGKTPWPICEADPYPRYEPGIRQVRCCELQGPAWLKNFGRWSIRLECRFVDEDGSVSGFLNLGKDRRTPRAGRQSRYARLSRMANGGPARTGEA